MSGLYRVLRLGPGVTAAERQASAIYASGTAMALAGIAMEPESAAELAALGTACLVTAAAAWWLPWRRWHPQATLVLALPAFAILAWATWLFGAGGTPAPFFVLVFVWAGLHHRPAGVLALTPAAAAAYVAPMLASGLPTDEVVFRSVVLVPVMVIVGLVIADRVHRLELTKGRLAQAEQWRGSLMLTLAHDVRAPLTAVQTTLEMLQEDGSAISAADRDRLTGLALRQAARIRRLATGLIELERIEAGQLALDRQNVPLRRAVDEALEHAGIAEPVVLVGPELEVRADPVRLDQILVNLATNARSYGRPPIVVDAEPADRMVRISVRDHGEGVPAGSSSWLFQRFSTADRAPGSVGLGLWAARQLVLAHGGDVRYEPAHPGARFVLTMPATVRESQPTG
jgi:signal transduction histidine kinase